MDTLFGSSKDTSVQYLPEQIADIQKTGQFKFGTALPGFQQAMQEGQNVYQQGLPGVNAAAQNLGGTAGQVQQTGANQAMMANTAAQVQQNIANQRADVGKYMTGQGMAGLNQALGAAGTGVQASQIPQDYALKYMQGQYGLPAQSYNAPYPGTQSSNQTSSPSLFDMGGKLAGLASYFL